MTIINTQNIPQQHIFYPDFMIKWDHVCKKIENLYHNNLIGNFIFELFGVETFNKQIEILGQTYLVGRLARLAKSRKIVSFLRFEFFHCRYY